MGCKILIVDDALFMRITIRRILEQAGYTQLLEACDGEEAIRVCKSEEPDLVLMDISMPKMNGIEAVREIRKNYPELGIVMCSAIGQEMMVMEAVEAGAQDFIIKPFKAEQILEAVKNYGGIK